MAPLRQTRANTQVTNLTMTRKSTFGNSTIATRGKRKADCSPVKEKATKRSALGELTNRKIVKGNTVQDEKKKAILKPALLKKTAKIHELPSVKTVVKPKQSENLPPPGAPVINGVQLRANIKVVVTNQTALKAKAPNDAAANNRVKTRLSEEFEKTGESLYSSALEELGRRSKEAKAAAAAANAAAEDTDTSSSSSSPNDDSSFASSSDAVIVASGNDAASVSLVAEQLESQLHLGNHEVPEGVADFDRENWDDVFQCSHYAMDIFNYLRSKEPSFQIPDYMDRQICLTPWMRTLLVDWMVEVQESFELNHETLYLGVKMVDMYLSKMTVGKETLQLVGAAAMFVASKYDERIPPLVDDFLYICDGAYSRKELMRMEINLLKVCDFNLGIPLSYRFLRRYARCGKITMPVLTLARFILEYSLMDYATVMVRDSLLAAAALYLALRMKDVSGWTPALQFYSGYKVSELMATVHLLNTGLHRKTKSPVMTVRNKYSHKIFFEVAKIPLLKPEELNYSE